MNSPQLFDSLQKPDQWLIAAPLSLADNIALEDLLSTEEITRAYRFRQTTDQQRFILAHSLKRYCLSHYLNIPPKQLNFIHVEKGKPVCDYTHAPDFNIAHSGDWVLLGLSAIGKIGVDVEHSDRHLSDAVADYALTPEQHLLVKETSQKEQLLMTLWTQKEAISKAVGLGLGMAFNTIDCQGLLGKSEYQHHQQPFYVETRTTHDQHLVSVATTNATPVIFYTLKQWDGRILSVDKWD